MAIQKEDVPGTATKESSTGVELASSVSILDISEAQALDLMYGKAFGGAELYDGPHAYTVEQLMEVWGYKSRSTVDKRMAKSVEAGHFVKVKIANPDGIRSLNAWVLTEIYEVWHGDSN
jgi:hypothetical protein